MATEKDDDYREYIFQAAGLGIKKIRVPSSYKITYSKVVPADAGQGYRGSQTPYAIRIYDGADNKQRAIILNVEYFRDLSLELFDPDFTKTEGEVEWVKVIDGQELVAAKVLNGLADKDKRNSDF